MVTYWSSTAAGWGASVPSTRRNRSPEIPMFVPITRFSFLSRLSLAALALAFTLPSCASEEAEYVRANTHPKPSPLVNWPKPTGEVALDSTKRVYDHFDG